MQTLFTSLVTKDDIPTIPGLSYRADYLSPDDEQRLVREIDRLPWDHSWKRRRQPYGAGYGTNGAEVPIPNWGRRLAERLFADHLADKPFDQMLVNEYLPGQGIALHRDYEPFDRTVVSLSLLSACVMDFHESAMGRRERLLLEPRSLLLLTDAARYDWQHGIAARKKDIWHGIPILRERRLSITFRSRKTERRATG